MSMISSATRLSRATSGSRIYTDDSSLIYVSTPFGLVVLDLLTRQFNSTVFTNSPVKGFTIYHGIYYLAVENGLYRFDPSAGNIIEDFSSWERVSVLGLPASYTFAREGTVNVFYWVDGPFGYALSSDADRSVLAQVSAEVYRQLGAPR